MLVECVQVAMKISRICSRRISSRRLQSLRISRQTDTRLQQSSLRICFRWHPKKRYLAQPYMQTLQRGLIIRSLIITKQVQTALKSVGIQVHLTIGGSVLLVMATSISSAVSTAAATPTTTMRMTRVDSRPSAVFNRFNRWNRAGYVPPISTEIKEVNRTLTEML